MLRRWILPSAFLPLLLLADLGDAQQVTGQDIDKILEKADKLLEEAKASYERGREKSQIQAYIEGEFQLAEARIKYLVVQEIGSADKQKIVADRLRALNQLNKLIHDGRVAVAAPPAEPASPKPTEDSVPIPKTEAPARPPGADVTARAAIPGEPKRREIEKTVRELFKEPYAKKSPADRKALARMLLEQAAKSQGDAASLWFLYMESADIGVQICDARLVAAILNEVARIFDVDGPTLKNSALTAAAKAAKTPDESWGVATEFLRLAEEWLAADDYDAADKAVTASLQHARKSGDPALLNRVTVRSKEVAEAKTRFLALKSVLETLAKNSDDPSANNDMGQFACFVKGSWDLGLRFLAKGSDPTLQPLAAKEIASAGKPEDWVALADSWGDLGAKEKSPLRKVQMLLHSKALYEGALPSSAGLIRAKIEKKLTELGSVGAADIDLLSLIDTNIDSVRGEFSFEGRTLILAGGEWDRLQIPYIPPDEYDLVLVAERKTGNYNLNIGLVAGGVQFLAMFDGGGGGDLSALDLVDNKGFGDNATTFKGKNFPVGKKITVLCSIRKAGVSVSLNGRKVIDLKGGAKRLALFGGWKMPNPNTLMLGSWVSRFEISQMTLTPVSGQGKKLR